VEAVAQAVSQQGQEQQPRSDSPFSFSSEQLFQQVEHLDHTPAHALYAFSASAVETVVVRFEGERENDRPFAAVQGSQVVEVSLAHLLRP
jgi:hypothetical protein